MYNTQLCSTLSGENKNERVKKKEMKEEDVKRFAGI